MDILLSTVTDNEGMWKKTSAENYCRKLNYFNLLSLFKFIIMRVEM